MTLKILLVDNHLQLQKVIERCLLFLAGVEVIGKASNGQEALVLAEQLKPDLILMDISTTSVNGLEVGRKIQTWIQPPKIIFLTLNDTLEYRNAANLMGAYGLASKDDIVVSLFPILRRLMRDSRG